MERSELLKLVTYNREEGKLYWWNPPQPNTKRLMGKEAGTINVHGYSILMYRKKGYLIHRLIWLIEKGTWPKGVVDHINGIKTDNRIENLRDVTFTQNTRNTYRHRAGKLLGTGWHKNHKRWRAFMRVNGKQVHLGLYDSEQEAHRAYLRATNG